MAELNTINTLFLPLSMEKEVQAHLDIPEGVRSEGWVYVLTNPYMPGIYKIGMTTNEPEFRANQISQGTGIPAPFEVSEAYFSENPKKDEQDIHEYLLTSESIRAESFSSALKRTLKKRSALQG